MPSTRTLIGATVGDPHSAGTYSGVPYHLFQQFERENATVHRINANPIAWHDGGRGIVDWHRTFAARALRRNAFWRYLPQNIDRLSRRLEGTYEAIPNPQAAIQIGVAGLPPAHIPLLAHIEFSINTATQLEGFCKTYGFSKNKDRYLYSALEGESKFIQRCQVVWTNSTWTADTLSLHKIPDSKLWIHPPACNADDPGPFSREWSNANILFVGKDWERKGGPLLVKAFRDVRRAIPNATLTIMGCSPAISEPGVEVVGFVDKSTDQGRKQIDGALKFATIFCMPSSWESVGLVYMEAALYGLPLVMLAGQKREEIFPQQMAIHLNTPAPTLLADHLVNLLRRPEECESIGRIGRLHVLSNYTWPVVTARLLQRLEAQGAGTQTSGARVITAPEKASLAPAVNLS